ncbi:MAG: L-threonylcarbamoyladenylate synthase [Bacteroidales bacterium]|nr:L-threonylcarbamoyladenylate synthase [Bacteroidales bacterium]
MLLRIHPENPSERQLRIVIECLNDGGVIIFPTDTIYALGCDIYKPKAVERVALIKGVKMKKANFSLICQDLSHLSEFSKPIDNAVYKLMRRNLPGAFTFILEANSNVPKIFQSKKKTIGIRVPDNNIARELVRMLGNPIMSTSVHDDDDILEYTTDPELIYERYSNQADLIIAGGYGDNIPSTIIDCTGPEPLIVREGKGELQ